MKQTIKKHSCIMVGPSPEGKGGISSVIHVYQDAHFFDDGSVILISSFLNGPYWSKFGIAAKALCTYFWLLLCGKGPVLHIHVASRASFWRKSIFIWMAWLFRRKIVFHAHSGAFITFIEKLPVVLRTIAVATIKRSDQILCLTSPMKIWFEQLVPKVPVQWWPNPMPASLFDLGTPTAERGPVVLYLGAIVHAKGMIDLLEAFAELHKEDQTARLVIGGTGLEEQLFKHAVQEKKLQDSVEFLGWIGDDEKKKWLRSARVLALASHVEAQPMVLLEAMASGAVIVSTNVGGIPDMIENGVHGLLVAPYDAKGFAQALKRVWTDVGLRLQLVHAAYQAASNLHKADEVCQAQHNLYRDLINRNRRLGSFTTLLRYRVIDFVRGSDSIGLLGRLIEWQYQKPEQLNQYSRIQLANYFAELRKSLPMYHNVAQFTDLPVIDKRFVKTHYHDLINPFYKGKLIRKKTGGSTGEPLVYFTGTDAHSYLWAGIFMSWRVAGFQFGDRVAIFAGSSLFATGSKQQIYYWLLNATVMSSFDMSAESMLKNGTLLEQNGYRLLYGFSAAIHRLARFYLDAGKTLNTSLRAIVCTAETLTPVMRRDIEAAFGVPCYSQYGCHDAGISAFECEQRDGYHLLSMRCYHEVLPNGELVSTDLSNRAMFMPRYNTGDLVRISNRTCSCGRGLPLIDEVVGRQNDMVTDNKGNAVHSEFFTHMFREDTRIYSFQVAFDTNRLKVNLHIGTDSALELAALESAIRTRVDAALEFEEVQVLFNQPFTTMPNGKHRFVMKETN